MPKKLTILFIPNEGVGHVNACIGLAEILRDRGHEIVFLIKKVWNEKLNSYGFKTEAVIDKKDDNSTKPGEYMAKYLKSSGILSNLTPIKKFRILVEMVKNMKKDFNESIVGMEACIKSVVEKHKPDVFILEGFHSWPSIINGDKPWVYMVTTTPLFGFQHEDTPPAGSGYETKGDRSQWNEFKEINDELFESKGLNQWLKQNGYPYKEDNTKDFSPFLNIYGYPQELDYTDVRPMPDNWLRIDSFMRQNESEDLEIPSEFMKSKDNTSKLIYLSLGSMGSVDVDLMKKFVEILSKTKHKFIVSKGILHDQYDLSDNMWGQRSVPQTKVLPLVDLVITHGGNNSVSEAFSFGKPMIVMPLFGDQFDNAQRIHEKGYGIRLDPYDCSGDELLNSIEKLLNDKILKEKLIKASERMVNSDTIIKVAERIELLVKQ